MFTGAIGLTEDSQELLRWMICGPELARCIHEFEDGLRQDDDDEDNHVDNKHHEQTRSHQNRFTLQVEKLVHVMYGMGNPFEEETKELLVLDTQDVKDEEVVNTVNTIEKIGNQKFNEFFKNRIQESKTPIFEPIKRSKLHLSSLRQSQNEICRQISHLFAPEELPIIFTALYLLPGIFFFVVFFKILRK